MLKISYSGMSCYLDCPLQYKYRYIDKVFVEQDIRNQLIGLALHDTLNKWYNGGDFNKALALEYSRPIFDELVSKNKVIWKTHENASVVYSMVETQLDSALDIIARENLTTQPLFSEMYFEEPVGDLFLLSGKIDLYLDRGEDSVLVDFKTSKTKYYTKPDQLALYSYAIFRRFNKHVGKCGYFFTALGEIDWYNFNQGYYRTLFKKFKGVVDSINAGKFQPMPTRKICGWCAYKDMCKFKVENTYQD
jgi:CRISPR/Cas system-associated exonuclease Cas4 (RecB family)